MIKLLRFKILLLSIIVFALKITFSITRLKDSSSKVVIFEYDSSVLLTDLSLKLNAAMKRIGQMSCEKSANQVSVNGGWCSKISGKNSSEHMMDTGFAKTLSMFLKGNCEVKGQI